MHMSRKYDVVANTLLVTLVGCANMIHLSIAMAVFADFDDSLAYKSLRCLAP